MGPTTSVLNFLLPAVTTCRFFENNAAAPLQFGEGGIVLEMDFINTFKVCKGCGASELCNAMGQCMGQTTAQTCIVAGMDCPVPGGCSPGDCLHKYAPAAPVAWTNCNGSYSSCSTPDFCFGPGGTPCKATRFEVTSPDVAADLDAVPCGWRCNNPKCTPGNCQGSV